MMEVIMLCLLFVLALLCMLLVWMMLSLREKQMHLAAQIEKNQALASSERENSLEQTRFQIGQISETLERLSQGSAQSAAGIDSLEEQMRMMSQVMTNTKKRGSWGEYQLEYLIRTYAGENPDIYEVQYTLDNGRIADGAFHLPGTTRVLCIDSKFPMENYARICQDEDGEYFAREFRSNVKKHINDVAAKYITSQTADQALLFIPSEAIYQYVCASCRELMDYAFSRRVMMVSPTSLCSVVYALLASSREFYQAKNLEEVRRRMKLLEEDAGRLQERAARAEKSAGRLLNEMHDLQVSARKTAGRIQDILSGKEEPISFSALDDAASLEYGKDPVI